MTQVGLNIWRAAIAHGEITGEEYLRAEGYSPASPGCELRAQEDASEDGEPA